MRLTGSQNVLHFGVKCSNSRRFLGLRPRPRWGAYDALRPPSPEGLLAFGNSSFAPSVLDPPLAPPNKIIRVSHNLKFLVPNLISNADTTHGLGDWDDVVAPASMTSVLRSQLHELPPLTSSDAAAAVVSAVDHMIQMNAGNRCS